jgi:hypothetical protein
MDAVLSSWNTSVNTAPRHVITIRRRSEAQRGQPASGLIKTKFIRIRQPVALGERIDSWRAALIFILSGARQQA